MSRLGRRPRIAAALVAALALILAPLLVTAPVQAEVDCTPYLDITHDLERNPDFPKPRDIVIDGTWPEYRDVYGFVVDSCPGDGWFDEGSDIKDLHGALTLANGTTDHNFTFHFGAEVTDFSLWARGVFDSDRYRGYSLLGRETLNVWATDGSTHDWIFGSFTFSIRRVVRFSAFNASPEPATKGSPLKLTGSLTRLAFDATGTRTWLPYAGKRVWFYFVREGGWVDHVSSTITTSTGHFAKTVTAAYDGCWQMFSPMTDTQKWAYSGYDCVDVR
jgi:hypothetical protein